MKIWLAGFVGGSCYGVWYEIGLLARIFKILLGRELFVSDVSSWQRNKAVLTLR